MDLSASPQQQLDALVEAIQADELASVLQLVKGLDSEQLKQPHSSTGVTPLHAACSEASELRTLFVQILLHSHAFPNKDETTLLKRLENKTAIDVLQGWMTGGAAEASISKQLFEMTDDDVVAWIEATKEQEAEAQARYEEELAQYEQGQQIPPSAAIIKPLDASSPSLPLSPPPPPLSPRNDSVSPSSPRQELPPATHSRPEPPPVSSCTTLYESRRGPRFAPAPPPRPPSEPSVLRISQLSTSTTVEGIRRFLSASIDPSLIESVTIMRTTRYHGRSALVRFTADSSVDVVAHLRYNLKGRTLDGSIVKPISERFSVVLVGLPHPITPRALQGFLRQKVGSIEADYRTSAVVRKDSHEIVGIGWIDCLFNDCERLVAELNGEMFDGAGFIEARWIDCHVPETWGLVDAPNGAPHPVFGTRGSLTQHGPSMLPRARVTAISSNEVVRDDCVNFRIAHYPSTLSIAVVVDTLTHFIPPDSIVGVAFMNYSPSRQPSIVVTLLDTVHLGELLSKLDRSSLQRRIIPKEPCVEVGFLPAETNNNNVRALFRSVSVRIAKIDCIGRQRDGRCFAYVQLATYQDCHTAIRLLDKVTVADGSIAVGWLMDDRILGVTLYTTLHPPIIFTPAARNIFGLPLSRRETTSRPSAPSQREESSRGESNGGRRAETNGGSARSTRKRARSPSPADRWAREGRRW